jgi:VWFA-related protein
MGFWFRRWIYICCFSLGCGFAQQKAPAGQSRPPESVPSGAANRRMTLDVVVTDMSGRPVAGLQERDFTLLNNNRPQNIVSFQAIEGGTKTSEPSPEIILVVDEVNVPFVKAAVERIEIEKFLRRNGGALARPVSIALFSGSGLTLGSAPTQDANSLIADLNRENASLRALGKSPRLNAANELERMSLSALGQLIDYEAKRPGRKLVIWISPGWPFVANASLEQGAKQKQDLFDYLGILSNGLRRARVALYAIDPMGTSAAGELHTSDYTQFIKPAKTVAQAQNGYLALQVLAYQSGGLAITGSNDVDGAIAACAAEANAFYVVSFDASAGTGPGQFHTVDFKLSTLGLKARTAAGYYTQSGHR